MKKVVLVNNEKNRNDMVVLPNIEPHFREAWVKRTARMDFDQVEEDF